MSTQERAWGIFQSSFFDMLEYCLHMFAPIGSFNLTPSYQTLPLLWAPACVNPLLKHDFSGAFHIRGIGFLLEDFGPPFPKIATTSDQ